MRKDDSTPRKPLTLKVKTSALLACVLATSVVVTGLSVNRPALADDPLPGNITLYVNTTDFGGSDATPGDGKCDAGGTVELNGETKPRCTLRAAIEEANAVAAAMGATTGQEILITLDPAFAGGAITGTDPASGTQDFMQATPASDKAPGPVWFAIKAPMTIDLKNKLSTTGPNVSSTVFAVLTTAAINVTISNASGILGGSTAFVIGAGTKNITIAGGETYQTATNQMQRFILVNNGALGVTFKSYRVGGLAPAATANTDFNGALVFAPNGQAGATTNVLVEGVDFTSPSTAPAGTGYCTATDGSACVNTAVTVGLGANVDGFEMRSSIVNNLKAHDSAIYNRIFNAYNIGSAGKLANLRIHDNTFNNNFTSATQVVAALVALPNGFGIGGTSSIVNNRFDNSGTPTQNNGIVWFNTATGTTPSGMSISDNYFNGFASTDIYISGAGIVTMERNTFGPDNAGRTGDVTETTLTSNVMIANAGTLPNKTNNGIISWMPGTATVQPKGCLLSFYVAPQSTGIPTGFSAPGLPVRADVFWTSYKTAEMYLGSTDADLKVSTTIYIPLPPEVIVNGKPTGNVRIQTQTFGTGGLLGQQQSSQYSQTQSITGGNITCTPQVVEATDIAPTYGPVAGGNQLTITGQGFDVQTPTVTFRYGSQNVPCKDVSVSNGGTQLTCTVPPSPRPGDGTGLVDVIVKSGVRVVGTFTNGYNYGGTKPAGLTSVSPQAGPIEGSAGCSVIGNGFVTPVGGLHFDGASWIDTGIEQSSNTEFTVDFSLDANGNSAGTAIIGAGPPMGPTSLGVSIDTNGALAGVGTVNAVLAASTDQGRHTAGFQAGVWSFDGATKSSKLIGGSGTDNVLIGATSAGDVAATSDSAFSGVIYNVRVWSNGALVLELEPAAWTVAGVTVYGLQDALTGELFANQGSGTLTAVTTSRAAVSVAPITLNHGGPVDQASITVVSDSTVTYACPPHASGRVSVSATINGVATNTLVNAYLYWVSGDLSIAIRGWTNANGLSYAQIIDAPGNSGAVEVPNGGSVPAGTTIWWTYTVTYSHNDPVTGQPSGTGQPGASGVVVTDAVLGKVCTIDVPVNTPVGCVASGEVPR